MLDSNEDKHFAFALEASIRRRLQPQITKLNEDIRFSSYVVDG